MKKILFLVKVCLMLWIGVNIQAQDCRRYENKCPAPPKEFKISSSSKSFTLKKMKKVNLNLTLFGNRAYFISAKGNSKLGKIHFRVIEANENKTVLYDNAADSYTLHKIFEISSTLNVIVEVSAPTYKTERKSECSAVLVAYQKL